MIPEQVRPESDVEIHLVLGILIYLPKRKNYPNRRKRSYVKSEFQEPNSSFPLIPSPVCSSNVIRFVNPN
jgi:hypothetical protein